MKNRVTGIIVHADGGKQQYILCKNCYDKLIDDIRHEWGLTTDQPIFLSSEYDYTPVCDECHEEIECEVIIGKDTINCRICEIPTDNKGTKLCNRCWEVMTRIDSFLSYKKAREIIKEKLEGYNEGGGYGYKEPKEDTVSSLLLEKIEIYEEYTDSVNFDIEDIKKITEIDRKLMERVNE